MQNLEAPLKGFNCCGGKMSLRWADSRFAKPRNSPEGERVVTFCVVQKVTKKHARTCKKLPVAIFCASETAETGRIANGREQGDHVSRRQGRQGFNSVCARSLFVGADSRFTKPRSSLKKVLIVAVRSCHCGELNRGLQNLETPLKRF